MSCDCVAFPRVPVYGPETSWELAVACQRDYDSGQNSASGHQRCPERQGGCEEKKEKKMKVGDLGQKQGSNDGSCTMVGPVDCGWDILF